MDKIHSTYDYLIYRLKKDGFEFDEDQLKCPDNVDFGTQWWYNIIIQRDEPITCSICKEDTDKWRSLTKEQKRMYKSGNLTYEQSKSIWEARHRRGCLWFDWYYFQRESMY